MFGVKMAPDVVDGLMIRLMVISGVAVAVGVSDIFAFVVGVIV